MTNLMSKKHLEKYIHKDSKICVIAFSQFESDDMLDQYHKGYEQPEGIWYLHILEPFFKLWYSSG